MIIPFVRFADQVNINMVVSVGYVLRIVLKELLKAVPVQFGKGLVKTLLGGGCRRRMISTVSPGAFRALLLLVQQIAFHHDLLDNIVWDKPGGQPLMRHRPHCGLDIPLSPACYKCIGRIQQKGVDHGQAYHKKTG